MDTIIMDETTDNSCIEQVSICFCAVGDNLEVFNLFLGVFDTID